MNTAPSESGARKLRSAVAAGEGGGGGQQVVFGHGFAGQGFGPVAAFDMAEEVVEHGGEMFLVGGAQALGDGHAGAAGDGGAVGMAGGGGAAGASGMAAAMRGASTSTGSLWRSTDSEE